MKRIALFVLTNLAVLLVLSITMRLLGIESIFNAQGTGLNMGSLLIYAAVIGFTGSFISLAMSKWMAKQSTGAQVIDAPVTETERWLVDTVARQAQTAGIGVPEVAIFPSDDINAFATGMNKNNALVAVSTGLLAAMPRDQAEAVIGHEISHVANGDMVTLALIQGVVNTFVIVLSRVIGNIIDRTVFKSERGNGPAFWVTAMIAEVVLGILASMIVMWFSRQREFRADAGGARLAGTGKMVAALETLRRNVDHPHLPSQLAAFGVSGRVGQGFARLFMSHPPLEERIQALRTNSSDRS